MKRHLLKRIDLYMLKKFLGLFLMTFVITSFILLMQFLWVHVRDLVGKGVEISVLAEFFIYAVMSVVPLALPLAILLASLMCFGNLGEKFELTAMKAAGVSLFRIMRSLMCGIAVLCVGAFFFSNYILPMSQTKLWALIFSLRQKSPELDIPPGEFYNGVPGYMIYVAYKDPPSGMLYDMMIYDYSNGFQDATVLVADSGQLFVTEDHHYLMLRLYDGEGFENLDRQQQRATKSRRNVPYRREIFTRKEMLIEFDTDLKRYDESVLADQHVSKDVNKLIHSIDSVTVLAEGRARNQSNELIHRHYFNRENVEDFVIGNVPPEQFRSIDSLYNTLSDRKKLRAVSNAVDRARQKKDQVQYNNVMLEDYTYYIRKHKIELHRKFTLAFACLIFFFIGAPLGAIIRKGGIGAPIVISVLMFVVYYIIDNTGYKMAREALWPVWAGMWLSSFVLLPIGIFLTYKAATDAALLNPEAWLKQYEKIKNKIYHEYHRRSNKRLRSR